MKIHPQDWPGISALFDEALDLPAQLRSRWLDELPESQRAHRSALEMLLANHACVETQDFLHTLPKLNPASDRTAAQGVDPGRSVGSYRLLRELGRGGMGTVWLAERSDGLLKRTVALKLPHPGFATRSFAERLARERDILAELTHPNIARLYDAGVSEDGQPYIALAYVEGTTLIEHCRARHMSVRERVTLFLQVLEAVQYAHSNLVVHRDLKPSNILVDEGSRVQLLDFGIAKLLVDGQAAATALTVDSGVALTPDYAAPEQISGRPASTASDVYSLGVLLYELLTGARPYHLRRDPLAPLSSAIEAVQLRLPSSTVADRALRRALRGDLDTIAMKALKFEPAARYATADAFALDLRRYLDGAPVLARPDKLAYRAAKFALRYRYAVGAAVLLVISLAAGLAGTAWQARVALEQARRALAVKDFLIGLFRQADPNKSAVQELTARAMLERGQDDLRTKLKDEPRLRAELSGVLSEVYSQLNDEVHAKPLAESRRDLTLELDGPHSESFGEALEALAEVQSALGDHEASYASYKQARDVYERHAGDRQKDLAEIGGHMAFQVMAMGRDREAADVLTASIPLMESALGQGHHKTLHYKTIYAVTLAKLGDFDRASRVADEVIRRLGDLDVERPTDAATVRGNLGQLMMMASRFQQAEALFREAGNEARHLWGPDSINALTDDRSLAQAQFEAGHFVEAARGAEDAATRAAKELGEDSVNTKLTESLAVRPLIMVGRAAAAEALARRSLASDAGAPRTLSPSQRDAENRLALALLFNNKADEATARLERLAASKPDTPNATIDGRTWLYLAGARSATGRLQEAAQAAEQAERLFETAAPNRDLQLARTQLTRSLIAASAGDAEQAQRWVASADDHINASVGSQHPMALLALLARAEALRAAGHLDQAKRLDASTRQELEQRRGAVLPKPLPAVF